MKRTNQANSNHLKVRTVSIIQVPSEGGGLRASSKQQEQIRLGWQLCDSEATLKDAQKDAGVGLPGSDHKE